MWVLGIVYDCMIWLRGRQEQAHINYLAIASCVVTLRARVVYCTSTNITIEV